MGKPEMKAEKICINSTDIKIIIAIGLCVLTSTIFKALGWTITVGAGENTRTLEIIQSMTAAISCLLCVQGDVTGSTKAGITRIKITVVAAVVALVLVPIDTLINNKWISILLLMAGVLLSIFLCKVVKAPYVSCRIGGVSYVLIACTLQGSNRLIYGGFRVLSTIYGVLMVMLVTFIFGLFGKGGRGGVLF